MHCTWFQDYVLVQHTTPVPKVVFVCFHPPLSSSNSQQAIFNLNSILFMPSQHITWNRMIKFKNVIYHLSNDCFFSLFSIFFCTFLRKYWFSEQQQNEMKCSKTKKTTTKRNHRITEEVLREKWEHMFFFICINIGALLNKVLLS